MSVRGTKRRDTGTAGYCGYGAHLYAIALRPGDPAMRCRHCGHVKGQRRRKGDR